MKKVNDRKGRVRTSAPAGAPEGEYRIVPVGSISPQGINPRHTFNEEKLAELTASVKEKGVIEPLLVRPLKKPKGKKLYELVAGERRLKAALRANLSQVSVIVNDYTDQQALEVAVVENEQREEVPVLEKAEGYKRLMDEFGYTAEELANKIGKSKGHVHSTVRLLRVPDFVRPFLNDGTITASHAEIISRPPNEEARAKLAREIIYSGSQVNVSPIRQARQLAERYTQELSKAPFDIADASLVADAGACTACPFKSGNNRDDYPDGRADVCNNVSCYGRKVEAATRLKLAALTEKKGATALTPDEMKKYMPNGYLPSGGTPYVELSSTCYQDSKYRSYKTLVGRELGKSVKLYVAVKERTNEVMELALRSEVTAALKRVHKVDLNGRAGGGKEAAARRLKTRARASVVVNVLGLVAAHFEKQARSMPPKFDKQLRLAAAAMLHTASNDSLRDVAKRRGVQVKDRYANFGEVLAKHAATMRGPQLFGLMMEAGVAGPLHGWKSYWSSSVSSRGQEILKAAGVDITALESAEVSALKARGKEREARKKKGGKK
jgi:ParB/RepB/Spo0J family partition protein